MDKGSKKQYNKEDIVGYCFGKWKIGDTIGSGSFGTVYEATNIKTGDTAAIKVANIDNFKNKKKKIKESIESILLFNERTLLVIWLGDAPNTIKYIDYGETNTEYGKFRYLVTERLGLSLQDEFDKNGVFSEERIRKLATDILQALKYLHSKGWVHLDIKPSNILNKNDSSNVKLIDFGTATRYKTFDGKAEISDTNGTLMYVSTYGHLGEPMHPRNDLQSLGFMLVELFTGKLPWSNTESLKEIKNIKLSLSPEEISMDAPECLKKFLKYTYDIPVTQSVRDISYLL